MILFHFRFQCFCVIGRTNFFRKTSLSSVSIHCQQLSMTFVVCFSINMANKKILCFLRRSSKAGGKYVYCST